MRAVVVGDYGPPESFTRADVPTPRPGPGQIQVRIAAASLNAADLTVASGALRDVAPLSFPHVPGNDFAGTVTELGEGVTAYAIGDEVFGQAVPRALREAVGAARPLLGTGALAEYAVVEADTPMIARRPAELDVEQAAAVPTAVLTALALLTVGHVQPEQTVLVVGATGGVGTALVPLLARAGARIVATARDTDTNLLTGLGAHCTIGYDDSEYPTDVDLVCNLAVPGDRLAALGRTLRPGGRLLTITMPPADQAAVGRLDAEVEFVLDVDGRYADLGVVAALARETSSPLVTIGGRYALDRGVQACVDFARRHTTGKVVVTG